MNGEEQSAYRQMEQVWRKTPPGQWPDPFRRALHQAARQRAATQIAPFFPPQVYIEPTNACNCNCIICPRQNMKRPIGYMDMGLYRSLIGQIAALGPSQVSLFNFGEPTLHPNLPEMIRLGIEHNLNVSFQTNGLLGNEETLRRILEAGLAYMGISVNGLVPEEYEKIRPGHRFGRLLDNLRLLRRLIDEGGFPCRVNITAQAQKSDLEQRPADLEAYKKTWLAVADSLSIFGMSRYDHISLVHNGRVEESDLCSVPRRPDAQMNCLEPFDRLVIKWDGRATVCCVDYDAQMVVGDLTRQSLKEVWTSPRLNNVRQLIKDRQYARLAICRTCPKFYSDPFTLCFQKTQEPALAC